MPIMPIRIDVNACLLEGFESVFRPSSERVTRPVSYSFFSLLDGEPGTYEHDVLTALPLRA